MKPLRLRLSQTSAFACKDYAKKHLGRDKAIGEIDREIMNVNGGAIA